VKDAREVGLGLGRRDTVLQARNDGDVAAQAARHPELFRVAERRPDLGVGERASGNDVALTTEKMAVLPPGVTVGRDRFSSG